MKRKTQQKAQNKGFMRNQIPLDEVLERQDISEIQPQQAQEIAKPGPLKKVSSGDRLTQLTEKVEAGKQVQEAVRDVILDTIKTNISLKSGYDENEFEDELEDTTRIIRRKRRELYDILDNLNEEIAGKNIRQVTAIFLSLLRIQEQLCMQKTDGVITVRTRLNSFFPTGKNSGVLRESLRQEVSLIFSPEEIGAIRAKLPEIDEDDAIYPLLTLILDQAYDVIQFNEMTGRLLVEMTNYFLEKLDVSGYGDTAQTADFRERHERTQMSLEKAIDDLNDVEYMINSHLQKYPILVELPKLLRALIQIKLGMLSAKLASKILSQIQSKMGEYARARSAVAFDFNRLPTYQHEIHLRQSVILNLHRDVLGYTSELLQQEFKAVRQELERVTQEIETASTTVQSNMPEYQDLLRRKARILKKLEEHRRRLDVTRSQERLVNVQHRLINEVIQKFDHNEWIQQKVDAQIKVVKIDPDKIRNQSDRKSTSRMVMAKRRDMNQ